MASPYFYSWEGGYKLSIVIYSLKEREDEGTYVNIVPCIFDSSTYDLTLSGLQINGQVEIVVVSQKEDQPVYRYKKTPVQKEVMRRTIMLEESSYIENNTIFIKVTCSTEPSVLQMFSFWT